ncbi:hypothetical protein [Kitasatospora sp. NPDC057223]|uniref:hypothetical protein n=1 Tax=Kitasatospora sp. NPDC057223 TaxID=3346055 RepID=UPI0036327AB1
MMQTDSRAQAQVARAVRVQEAVAAAVACGLCPEVTPERGVEILAAPKPADFWGLGTATARARASELVDDPQWRGRALAWISAYRHQHGHGPTWKTFREEAALWPDQVSANIRRIVLLVLARGGHLDGTRTPFGLRVREERVRVV